MVPCAKPPRSRSCPEPAVEIVHGVMVPQLVAARAKGYRVHATAGSTRSSPPASTWPLPLRALMTSRTPEPVITSSTEEPRQVPPPQLNAAARAAPADNATNNAAEIIAIRLINLPSLDALVFQRSRADHRPLKLC